MEDWKDKLAKFSREKLNHEVEKPKETKQQVYINSTQKTIDGLESEHTDRIKFQAKAPYNFVPLNDTVVETDNKPNEKDFTFDRYYPEKFTGYINLNIETITPLYIRDSRTQQQFDDDIESKDIPEFFSPSGKIRIPGSSLRGLVRTMVEIVSFGKFNFFDKRKRLFYRGLADKSGLRNEYQQKMSSYDFKQKKANYNVLAGVLVKEGTKYYIHSCGKNYRQIPRGEAKDKIAKLGESYKEFCYYETPQGYIVVSGYMQNKKREWLINFPADDCAKLQLHEDDVYNYLDDSMRSDDAPNLIKLAQQGKRVPCFYVRWKDDRNKDRIAFGHTGMFRLAYEKLITEHIPESLKDEEIIDFAEAIFGNATSFAGRVFFEDAFLTEQFLREDVLMGERTPHILSSPKPTTFQHYLTQPENNLKKLRHYNSNSTIRGHKLYWHKTGTKWEQKDQEKIKKFHKQYTKINPVKPGVQFVGKIRFENLSRIELGALLFTLKLPPRCYHKIGMGKPLGLGSIYITPKLYLSNRNKIDKNKRYTQFSSEWNNIISESTQKIDDLKETFNKHVLSKIQKEKNITDLWDTKRLLELKKMLNIKHGQELEKKNKIKYMLIDHPVENNQFIKRPILPKPSNV